MIAVRERRLARVALLIETSSASGRDMLRGIARFVRETRRWSIYHEPGSRTELPQRWSIPGDAPPFDGMLARIEDPRLGDALARLPIPIIDLLGGGAGAKIPLVHVDHAAIVQLCVDHFLERGFRSLAFYGFQNVLWSEARAEAFRAQTLAASIPAVVLEVPSSDGAPSTAASQENALASWIRALPKPVGIMACFDPAARQVLEVARREGFAVPSEVAVVGVDDDEPLCELTSPAISSVDANHVAVGYRAAALLDRLLDGEDVPSTPLYAPPARVVVRSSSDVLATDDPHLATALQYIREHACHGIGVDEVVRHVAISRSVLARRFRSELGRSVHDEIVRVRLSRIQELLASQELPIKIVAERAGFDFPEQLSRFFRLHTGRSPTEYRRNVCAREASPGRG